MPVVPKEVLAPARYYTLDGPVEFTLDDLTELCGQSNALIASGRHIPVPLEHQNSAIPLSHADRIANKVLHNTGWVEKFYFKGDRLWCDLNVEHPEVYKNLGTIRYVSPEIRGTFPADGKTWRNVITHVALTTQPVWKDQAPFHIPADYVGDDGAMLFPSAQSRLSLAGSLRLSMADQADDSLASAYRLPKGGVWFRGRYFSKYVPKAVIQEAESAGPSGKLEVADLLRKITARTPRKAPSRYASLQEPYQSTEGPTRQVAMVPADHFLLNDEMFPPMSSQHGRKDPILAWEDSRDGKTYAVSGQNLIRRALRSPEPPELPTLLVQLGTPLEARLAAIAFHQDPHDDDREFFQSHTGTSLGDPAPGSGAVVSEPGGSPGGASGGPGVEASVGGADWEHPYSVIPVDRSLDFSLDSKGTAMAEDYLEDLITDDDSGGKDDDKEGKDEGDTKKDEGAKPAEGGGGGDDLGELMDLLEKFNVPLPREHVKTPNDLIHYLANALKMMDQMDQNNAAAGAGGDSGPSNLEPVSPTTGAVAMSIEKQKEAERQRQAAAVAAQRTAATESHKKLLERVATLEARLSLNEKELTHERDLRSKDRVRTLSTDVDVLVSDGRLTKADGEDIKGRLEKFRLSLVNPNLSPEVVEIYAELRQAKKVPKGTFFTEEEKKSHQLSLSKTLDPQHNATPWAQPGANEAISKERLQEIENEYWSNTGIPVTNGKA